MDLEKIADSPALLAIGSAAIDEALESFRESRISQYKATTGLVIQEATGERSPTIRLSIQDALAIGLRAIAKHVDNFFDPMTVEQFIRLDQENPLVIWAITESDQNNTSVNTELSKLLIDLTEAELAHMDEADLRTSLLESYKKGNPGYDEMDREELLTEFWDGYITRSHALPKEPTEEDWELALVFLPANRPYKLIGSEMVDGIGICNVYECTSEEAVKQFLAEKGGMAHPYGGLRTIVTPPGYDKDDERRMP